MDTDYDVPPEVDRIRARVLKIAEDGNGEVETWSKQFPLSTDEASGSGRYSLPASFSVVPDEADMDREVAIEVEGLLNDSLVVARRVRTGFKRGEFRVLRMFLYRACSKTDCPDGTSCGCPQAGACGSPSCVDEFVDPNELEVIDDPGVLPANSSIPTECGPGRTICASECVDTATDPRFCGNCTTACPSGEVCAAGQCVGPTDCRNSNNLCEGFTYCDETTGACLRGCAVDEQCGNAETCDVETHECVCQPDLSRCPPLIGDCVDTNTDLAYCGDCDISCPSNNVCAEGVCIDLGDCRSNGIGCSGFSYCDESSGDCVRGCLLDEQCGAANEVCDTEINDCICSDGLERCPPMVGACIDTQTDPTYCGNCNTSCARGEVCEDGVCVDPDCRTNGIGCSGFTYCDPNAGTCLPGCERDEQCLGANESCNVTTRTCECDAGLTSCDGACVDVDSDPQNCGSCETACGIGEACEDGVCVGPECDAGLTECDGACVSLQFDEANCGSCGEDCGNGLCFFGQCVGSP